ncbi:MAG: M20/M25/M40 family metallo-hydrolase [Clostridia bacterium]|nr:M20/M25/M40 family metallo-hydrolase [Clostridia bacterium]
MKQEEAMDRIFARIESLFPVYTAFWEKICSFETPSDDKAALDEQTRFIADFAESRGFAVTVTPFPAAGNCLTVETRKDVPPKIALLAHLDTVHPAGSFGKTPVHREGDLLRGPGVIDCKGGACAALLTAEALMTELDPAPPVRVILTTDEEVSARYSGQAGVAFIQEQARGVLAAFNCETGRPGVLTVGRKGILRVEVTVQGKAAHAGNDYFSGVSAVKEAALKILAIEKNSVRDGVTFNCGVISGGTKYNVVPDACRFEVDVRGKTALQLQNALDEVKKIAGNAFLPGTAAVVKVISQRPPMERLPETDLLFEKVSAAAARYGLEQVRPVEKGGGSDSAYLIRAGIPTVCSFGPTGSGEHTTEETALIPSLSSRSKLLAASIMEVIRS